MSKESKNKETGSEVEYSDENVLCILPFAEPHEYTDKLRRSIPGLKLKWIDQKTHPLKAWMTDTPLPAGTLLICSTLLEEILTAQIGIFKDVTSLMTLRMVPKLDEAPNLRYVHVWSAGTEHLASSPWFTHRDVVMTSSSGCHGPQIAEWVFMTLLSQTHQFKTMLDWSSKSKWGSFEDHYGVVEELR
jgi:hypothetical protein